LHATAEEGCLISNDPVSGNEKGRARKMSSRFDRREFIRGAVGGGTALLASAMGVTAPAAPTEPGRFRFVHFTDSHIQPERGADQGVIMALERVHRLDPRPDFIQLGGDMIMDALGEAEPRSRMQFELFTRVMSDHTDLPLRYCIGNHDVFGWKEQHGVSAAHALYGKTMAAELWGFDRTYYAYDHKGWRFYVLDNIQQDAPDSTIVSYQGYIDEEQWAWLEADLAAKDPAMPAVVTCHIPILTVTMFNTWAHRFEDRVYQVPSAAVCQDAIKLATLFSEHNVRLNLSGHIHQLDRVDFRGVTYICDGAVSGNWWKGPLEGLDEGFGVVDLHPDGSFEHEYVRYGWTARE
jgi:3',5'-cyclic-AMP phosphodiesterase